MNQYPLVQPNPAESVFYAIPLSNERLARRVGHLRKEEFPERMQLSVLPTPNENNLINHQLNELKSGLARHAWHIDPEVLQRNMPRILELLLEADTTDTVLYRPTTRDGTKTTALDVPLLYGIQTGTRLIVSGDLICCEKPSTTPESEILVLGKLDDRVLAAAHGAPVTLKYTGSIRVAHLYLEATREPRIEFATNGTLKEILAQSGK